MPMKFVAYYRVSTARQGLEGYGIQAQKDAVARYLASLDCELLGSFEEVESGANNQRPKLGAAIQMAKAKKAVLVISKLDRLGRSASFLLQLQESGVDFVACDMPSCDKFSVGILALIAQRERELISERTKAGLAVAKQRGIKLGNPNAATALEKAGAAIQQRKQQFAKQTLKIIQEVQSTGITSLMGIADCLNKRGERTARNGRWTAKAVKRVLATA